MSIPLSSSLRGGAVVAGLFCAVGCGPGEVEAGGQPPVEEPREGNRLVPVMLDAGGGAHVLQHFWDSELEIECTVGERPDGQYRCVPSARFRLHTDYQDAQCTVPVHGYGKAGCGLEVGDIVREIYREQNAECHGETFFRLTGAVESTYAVRDEGCMPVDHGSEGALFSVESVSESRFVEFTPTLVPTSDLGLVARVLSGSDGSSLTAGAAGSDGQACQAITEGAGPCLPDPMQFVPDASLSDACVSDDVITVGNSCSDDLPKTFFVGDPEDLQVHGIGSLHVSDVFSAESNHDSVCGRIEADAIFAELGARIDTTGLPVTEAAWIGSSVQAEWRTSGDGTPLRATGRWRDAQQRICEPTKFADGTTRCVHSPRELPSQSRLSFADPACTVVADGDPFDPKPDEPQELMGLIAADDTSCRRTKRIVRLRLSPDATHRYELDDTPDGTVCGERPLRFGERLWMAVDEVDLSAFPSFELVEAG